MTSIKTYLKRFEAYKNGIMDPGEVKRFFHDLKADQNMAKAWKEYNDMMLAFSDKEAVSLREKLDKAFLDFQDNRVKRLSKTTWYRAIAATLMLGVMGALLYFYCSSDLAQWPIVVSDLTDENTIESQDSIKIISDIQKPDDKNDIKEAEIVVKEPIASIFENEEYQISPIFSELLYNVYRGQYFKLTQPTDSIMFSGADSILFTWETNISEKLYFDILDRDGHVVYTHAEAVESPWKFKPNLEPAIYMFRFATKQEPIWMGVIVKI